MSELTFTPFTPLATAPEQWRVAIVTTAGAYLSNGWHAPFDAPMPTFREFPSNVEFETIAVQSASDHATNDGNVIFPLTPLHDLARQRYIKEVAPLHYSFAPDVADPLALASDTALSCAWRLKRATVNLVLVIALGGSEQVAATVARAAETVGVPSLVLGTNAEALRSLGIPRAVYVDHPGTAPMGKPGNHPRMQELLKEALSAAQEMPGAGSLWHLKFKWQG